MHGFDGEYSAVHPKARFWCLSVKICKTWVVRYSKEKPIFNTFVDLSPTFCPRFLEETDFHF